MNNRSVLATRLRHALARRLRPHGKLAFLRSLPPGAAVLDVGCGNASPRDAKLLRPDLRYHGLDVADYNQNGSVQFADTYTLVTPAGFAGAILRWQGQMDAVVSAHNLEHCDEPAAVLEAMARALRPGGRLYLAFPSEASVGFPSRRGTLNFFDDPTHQQVPRWEPVLRQLRSHGLSIGFARARYRPRLLALAGLVLEPLAWVTRRNDPLGASWALYGFEAVVWAQRPAGANGP